MFTVPAGFDIIRRERGPATFSPELVVCCRVLQTGDPAAVSYQHNAAGMASLAAAVCVTGFKADAPIGSTTSGANASTTSVSSLDIGSVDNAQDATALLFGSRPSTGTLTATGFTSLATPSKSGNSTALAVLKQDTTTAGTVAGTTLTSTEAARMRGILITINAVPAIVGGNFDGTPTCSGNEAGYEVSGVITAADTISAVAVLAGSSTPSHTQIHDGLNAAGTGAEAAAATTVEAGAFKLNLEPLEYPIYDVHVAVGAHVVSFTNQMTLPLAGSRYVSVDLAGGSIPSESLWYPATATGDVVEMPLAVPPSGVPFSEVTATGGFSLAAALTGRQYIDLRTYDYSAKAWLAVEGLTAGEFGRTNVNNSAPEEIQPIPDQQVYTGIPMDEIRLDTVYVRDIDNDRLVFDLDNALPSGLEIAEIVDQDGPRWVIRGTPEPGTAGMTSHTITVTDIAGEQLVMTPFTVTVTDSAVVPDVVGDDLATATAAVAATGLQVASIAYAGIVDGTDEGDIFAIAPPPGTQLTPGAGVALSVAGWQFTAYSDVLLNNTDSPIEENVEVNYRLYADGDVDSPDYRDPDDRNTAIIDADGRILLKSNIAADTWVEAYKVNADRSRSEIWSGRVEFG
jgi:hypothetical protein